MATATKVKWIGQCSPAQRRALWAWYSRSCCMHGLRVVGFSFAPYLAVFGPQSKYAYSLWLNRFICNYFRNDRGIYPFRIDCGCQGSINGLFICCTTKNDVHYWTIIDNCLQAAAQNFSSAFFRWHHSRSYSSPALVSTSDYYSIVVDCNTCAWV